MQPPQLPVTVLQQVECWQSLKSCKSLSLNSSTSSNNTLERYLSPVSGRIATIVLPLFSGLFATSIAAQRLAPDEIPTNKPSMCAENLAV